MLWRKKEPPISFLARMIVCVDRRVSCLERDNRQLLDDNRRLLIAAEQLIRSVDMLRAQLAGESDDEPWRESLKPD